MDSHKNQDVYTDIAKKMQKQGDIARMRTYARQSGEGAAAGLQKKEEGKNLALPPRAAANMLRTSLRPS